MLFQPSTIKKFHAKILFVAWLCDLSWEVKMFHLFFQGKTSRKFLSLLLIYLPVFWLRISSCHGLSCVHVRASWYEFHCVVCRCGWLKRYLHAAKVQATRVPMLSPFSLFVFVSSFLHYHICMFFLFPLCIPSDLKIGYEKSILTRTETLSLTTCFKEPLLFITLFLKRTCFYLLFICYLLLLEHETRARYDFCIVTPKSCVRDNINWEIKSNYAREIREINPSLNYENLYFFVVKRNHFKLAYIVVYFHLICLSKELVTRH